jgi:uncharacterized protein (TIRG00374 family)
VATDLQNILGRLDRLSLRFVLFAWAYYSVCQYLSAYRWQLFLKAKGITVPLNKLFSFYMVGMFANNFMPSTLGGDVVKGYDLYHYTNQGRYAVASVILDRFTGFVGLSIIAIVSLGFGLQDMNSPLLISAVGGTTVFLGGMVVVIWHPPLSRFIMNCTTRTLPKTISEKVIAISDALVSYKNHMDVLSITVLLSVLLHLMFAVYYSATAYALGLSIPTRYFILFLPTVTLVSLLPLSFGGLGVREGVMVLLFSRVGIPGDAVLSVALTVHIVNTLLSLWGGGILLLRKPIVRQDKMA